jgi:hypothetical protein
MMDGRQKEEIHRIRIGWRNLSGTYIFCTENPVATSYPNPSNKPTLSITIITVKPTDYNPSKQFTLSTSMYPIEYGIR